MLWNMVLTLLLLIGGWILKEKSSELTRVSDTLNKTREEIAKEYVTKSDAHTDINRVLARLESLDSKLDRLIENYVTKGHS
jgi:hypothetical protein